MNARDRSGLLALATLAIAAIAPASAWAVAVDLRPAAAPAARTPAPEPIPATPTRSPARELLATRHVFDDLMTRTERLHGEARELDDDAAELWNRWRLAAPEAARVDAFSASSRPVDEGRRSDAFGLHTAARATYTRSGELMERLEKAERDWWRLWHAVEERDRARRGAQDLLPAFERLVRSLRSASERMLALDGEIARVQSQYDLVRPLLLEHAAGLGAPLAGLLPARHWTHAQRGVPREPARYDFDARYEAHYEEALERLRAPEGAR